MKDLIRKLALTTLMVVFAVSVMASGKVTFEVSTPLTVALGEAFRVEFSLNANPDKNTFKAPSFEGFDVLAGPATSSGRSISVINGSMTQSVNYTITYVLLPKEAGNVTIGQAEIAVDGTVYHSSAQPVEIVNEGAAGGSRPAQGGASRNDASSQEGSAQGQLDKDDILLRAVASRTTVFKGEPLRVTFKLYQRVNIVGYEDVKFPSFNGFWAQELDADNARRKRETFNGKVYETLVAREFLLYPQQTGTLTIDPAELTAVAQVVVQGRHNMDPFFGGGPDIYNVPRKVSSSKITVKVKPLPAGAPESFSGAVGRFEMSAKLPPERLAANSAATYSVKISGTGNLSFVQAPKLTLPTSFEQYNVKTTESINTTASGITGYRNFEYPFIARADGTYDILPLEFAYFDPQRMAYVTLQSKPLTLEITPDANAGGSPVVMQGQGVSKEEVKLLGEDIRFIKLGSLQLQPLRSPFLFSGAYWAVMAAVVAFFAALYFRLRQRIRDSHNVALVRGKRANKVAVQRFRMARKYMEAQDRHSFYEEMLRALWGYMGDKFNIPVSNLTKDNVREELHKRGVSEEESARFTTIVTQCDEAQYSPQASAQMSEVYTQGVDFISRIESVIKR